MANTDGEIFINKIQKRLLLWDTCLKEIKNNDYVIDLQNYLNFFTNSYDAA